MPPSLSRGAVNFVRMKLERERERSQKEKKKCVCIYIYIYIYIYRHDFIVRCKLKILHQVFIKFNPIILYL